MEHETAIKEYAAEKYLLREMTDAESEDFEEHFFDCRECAESVRDGAILADSVRAMRPTAAAVARPRFAPAAVAWGSLAAAVGLVALLGIQNLRLRNEAFAPRALTAVFLSSATRGANEVVVNVDRKQPFTALDIDIQDSQYRNYRCDLHDPSGRVRVSIPVSAEQTKETVRLLVPTRDLQPGNYTLTVDGLGPAPSRVASYPFVVRVQ